MTGRLILDPELLQKLTVMDGMLYMLGEEERTQLLNRKTGENRNQRRIFEFIKAVVDYFALEGRYENFLASSSRI